MPPKSDSDTLSSFVLLNSILLILSYNVRIVSTEMKPDIKYFLSRENRLCSDVFAQTINNSNECIASMPEIRKIEPDVKYKGEEEFNAVPKGCYLMPYSKYLYWNNHATGSPNKIARQICTLSGTSV